MGKINLRCTGLVCQWEGVLPGVRVEAGAKSCSSGSNKLCVHLLLLVPPVSPPPKELPLADEVFSPLLLRAVPSEAQLSPPQLPLVSALILHSSRLSNFPSQGAKRRPGEPCAGPLSGCLVLGAKFSPAKTCLLRHTVSVCLGGTVGVGVGTDDDILSFLWLWQGGWLLRPVGVWV